VINDQLTVILAEQILHWRVAQGRFLMPGRVWKPAWRFQPTERLEDSFSLLDAADASEYSIFLRDGIITARVVIAGSVGEARDTSKPRAITFAIARAIGLDPAARPTPKTGADNR
jgi:hypothetical protein